MLVVNSEEHWDLIIEPKRKLLDLPIREVIRYRDLIVLFIKRDFVTQYKQTILGPLWFVINPLISTIMYIFVFGNLAKLSTDGVPQFFFITPVQCCGLFFRAALPMQRIFLLQIKTYLERCIFRGLRFPSVIYSEI